MPKLPSFLQDFAHHHWAPLSTPKAAVPACSPQVPLPLRLFLAMLGGTMVFLSYPSYDLFYLIYFALALELWAVVGTRPRTAFWLGFLAGGITNLGGFYWISELLIEFGHMHEAVAWSICLLATSVQGLVFALWAYLVQKIQTRYAYLTAIAAMLAVEWFFPMIFPWYLGNSQYKFILAVQTADLFGVQAVTLLIVVVNLLLYEVSYGLFLRLRKRPHPWPKAFIASAALYVVFCVVYGAVRIAQIDKAQAEAPSLSVGMVEADIGIWEKEEPDKIKNNLFIHQSLTAQLDAAGAELIVWPETSYIANLVWGSQLSRQDGYGARLQEIDALFAPWFQPQAKRLYALLDEAFGEDFLHEESIHESFHRALAAAAPRLNYKGLTEVYGSMMGGYTFPCNDQAPQMLRCPYRRIVPDNIQYYLPSRLALRQNREEELKRRSLPFDIHSPMRPMKAALFMGTLSTIARDPSRRSQRQAFDLARKERETFNAAKLLAPDGAVLGSYRKNVLLLFGEYVPLGEVFPIVYDWLPEAGDLTAGSEVTTFQLRDDVKIGPIICYEDILPRFVRRLSKLEPNLLVNITNDAWFGKNSEPYLHMALSLMRSVEHRLWLVRSTNTGISVFVDAVGRIVAESNLYEPEILQRDVKLMSGQRTLYSYLGDLLGYLALLWLCALCLLKRWARKSQSEKSLQQN